MATFNFKLRNTSTNKPTTINYYISLGRGCRLRGATPYSILPKQWNVDSQEVRSLAELSGKQKEINKWLRDFKKWSKDQIDTLKAKHNTNDKLKEALKYDIDVRLGKIIEEVEIIEEVTFYSFVEKFIEQSKNRIVEKTGKPVSIRTIQDYNRTIELIKEFEELENYRIAFETINLDFYYAFKEFLEDKDFALNTIGKFIKNITTFLNSATEQGHNNNLAYKSKHFIKPTEQSEQIYLNEDELESIIKLDLSDNKLLDHVRDLFILACYTGLRYSDFSRLTKKNIGTHKGRRVFRLYQQKTNEYLPIPIHPIVEMILKKWNGNPPDKLPSQKMNDSLEIIGGKAKINDIITINFTKGGKQQTKMVAKHQMIKNHTARRSFCTNAYLSGMEALDIMAISGHNSEKTFMNYIKATKDEKAIKIADSKFFKPKLKVV